MSLPEPSFSLNVDVTNPGQFFACCGLLELAHRLWPEAEGWFSSRDALFNVRSRTDSTCTLTDLVDKLVSVGIEGELSTEERAELDRLEARKKALPRGQQLPKEDEARRASLGKQQREGALIFGEPFNLLVAWWQENHDVPKTFAGGQEVLRMALAMLQEASRAVQHDPPLEYRCLLEAAGEELQDTSSERTGRKRKAGPKVEPFYFDAVRFAHALDAGFSLDVQEKTIRAPAAPLAELLSLIGLQRFRPRPTENDKRTFTYFTWHQPLSVVSAAVVCGAVAIGGARGYQFRLQFRHDQKRYKAFGFATPVA